MMQELIVKWLPISTAPKDGMKILLWDDKRRTVYIGYWEAQRYHRKPRPFWQNACNRMDIGYQRTSPPTHWMHLPLPPEKEQPDDKR